MEGNDVRQYKSIKTKKGSHVWIPLSSSKTRKITEKPTDRHRYEIHDNGAVPFIVEDYPKKRRLSFTRMIPFLIRVRHGLAKSCTILNTRISGSVIMLNPNFLETLKRATRLSYRRRRTNTSRFAERVLSVSA
jgi:hypothetical protein